MNLTATELQTIIKSNQATLEAEMDSIDIELAKNNSMSAKQVQHLSDYRNAIKVECYRRELVKNNVTGIIDKHGKMISAGHKLKDQYGGIIVIDNFGAYKPGAFTYHPYGATNLTSHYYLSDLVGYYSMMPDYEIIR
jgi:hypothetical protein